ncbi:MAG: extracellular solute-binding protein [Phycisphaerales bacterium]|nr:extracellular solute-binding protein [Phycisphaerales bacterium]
MKLGSWCRPMLGLSLLSILVQGCQPSPPQVVVYVSTDEQIARPILAAFEEQTGIDVLMVGDTEVRKTTGLLDRIRRERSAPVADVLWSSEAIGTAALAREGLLAPHHSSMTHGWPEAWRNADHLWHAFSPRPRVLVYDPMVLSAGDVPETWTALADPKWRGKIVLADPRYGTTGGHLAAMRWWMSGTPGRWDQWLDAMQAQAMPMLPGGNAAVVDVVRRGQAVLGMTDADDVHAANAAGANLAMVIPRHSEQVGAGAMLMPNTVAIVQGARHPREAAALADFLLGDETARLLAVSHSRNVPISPAVADSFPELHVDDPLVLDIDQIEHHWAPAVSEVVTRWGPQASSVGSP